MHLWWIRNSRAASLRCSFAANDDAAKKTVTTILDQFGWETEDMGRVEGARAIEPLCMLWCIPGFLRNNWTHAFRLLKKD
jgi:8-hydroxy-5-deazaflavin:NADPH oxidoreductase